jgi:CheY-like chemotaxis protein
LRVLVVDDAAELRRLLRLILEAEAGTEVLEAGSGEEALEVVERHEVDLVVMDQSMPGMSGTTCIGALHERRPGLEVVAFTSMPDGEAAFLRAGAAAHFTKSQVGLLVAFVQERAAAADEYRSGE